MSISASTSLIIGFEVCREDFWWSLQTVQTEVTCPRGHLPPPGSGPFCTQCGAPFASQKQRTFTANPRFARLVGDDDPKGAAGRVWDPYADQDSTLEGYTNARVFGDFEFIQADLYQNPDTPPHRIVLGQRVADCPDIITGGKDEKSSFALTEQEVIRLFAKCRGLAYSLGISSSVKLYLTAYCGY